MQFGVKLTYDVCMVVGVIQSLAIDLPVSQQTDLKLIEQNPPINTINTNSTIYAKTSHHECVVQHGCVLQQPAQHICMLTALTE